MSVSSKVFPFSIMFSYSLGRTFIAFSLFLTLLFNQTSTIFPEYAFDNYKITHTINWLRELNFFYLIGYENILFSKFIALVTLLISLIGFFPRFTGIMLFYLTNSFLNLSSLVEGGDVICSNLSFMLLPIVLMDNRCFLYDFSKNIFNTELKKVIANNIFLFIQLQISFLYLNAAIGKLAVKEWVDGTAAYYYMDSSVYGFGVNNIFIKNILNNELITVLLTWGTLVIEFLLFTCLFIKNSKKKYYMFLIGVCFHFAIILIFGLVSFFFAMLGSLTLYLTFKKEKINYYD